MTKRKPKRELTAAEELAYLKLAQAAQDLRDAQEAAEEQQRPKTELVA